MDRSLKLKLSGPNPDKGYDVGSVRKQCPNITDGGCMAANGDECSMMTGAELQRARNSWYGGSVYPSSDEKSAVPVRNAMHSNATCYAMQFKPPNPALYLDVTNATSRSFPATQFQNIPRSQTLNHSESPVLSEWGELKEPWPSPGKARYRIAAIGRGGQLVGADEAEVEGEVPDQRSIPESVVRRSMKVEMRRGEV